MQLQEIPKVMYICVVIFSLIF